MTDRTGRGSDVLLYTHCSSKFTPYAMIINLGIEDSCWGTIELVSNESLLVGVVYRSSSTDNNVRLNRTIGRLDQHCSFTQLLLIGDFNYPEISWYTSTVSIVALQQ